MNIRARLMVLGILAALSVCACGGGGGGSLAPTGPAQGPPSPSGAIVPNATRTYELASVAGSYDLPPLGGFGGSLALPAAIVPPNTQLKIISTFEAPPGVTVSQDVRRGTQRGTQATGALDVYFYTTIQLSSTVTFPTLPGFSVTLPATVKPKGFDFFYAISDPTPTNGAKVQYRSEGPATVSGQTVTFAPSSTPLTLRAGQPYTIAFYAITAIAATPTPTVAPAAKIYVSTPDKVLTFDAKGAPTTPSISGSFGYPAGLAVDAAGKIYVSSFSSSGQPVVNTYTPKGTQTTPTIPIAGTEFQIGSLAVSPTGKIFVSGSPCCYTTGTVTAYSASGAPTTPTFSGNYSPLVAVGATGNIYITDQCFESGNQHYCGSLGVWNAAGSKTSLGITQLNGPVALAVDAAGKIYVGEGVDIRIFNADGSPTFITIFTDATGIAVDASGKIYAANNYTGTVTTYNPDGTQTTPTITGLDQPWAIAVH